MAAGPAQAGPGATYPGQVPRVVVISGAGGGIGRASALRFAADGAAIAAIDVDQRTCDAVASEVEAAGGTAVAFGIDVSDEAAVQRMTAAIDERFGRADVLVHAAIQRMPGHLESLPTESFDRLLAVGLRGGFLLGRELGTLMLRQGSGVLVFIGSTAAHAPHPNTRADAPGQAALGVVGQRVSGEWG